MKRFEVGKTYIFKSPSFTHITVRLTVVSRTKKTLKARTNSFGEVEAAWATERTYRIQENKDQDREFIYAWRKMDTPLRVPAGNYKRGWGLVTEEGEREHGNSGGD